MFKKYFKKRKIRKYSRVISVSLRRDWGRRKSYSKEQVDTAIDIRLPRHHFSEKDLSYVYAMFLSKKEFSELYKKRIPAPNYNELRNDVSIYLFGEQTNFSCSSLYNEAQSNSGFLDGGCEDSSGSFDGGGGDGGC